MKDEFYRNGLIIKIVPNLIFFILLIVFIFSVDDPFTSVLFWWGFAILSAHFLPFITFLFCGVLMIIESIRYKGVSRALALISLALSVGAVVSEICILIKVGGIYASGLLFINGGLILAIWACWIAEFVIKK